MRSSPRSAPRGSLPRASRRLVWTAAAGVGAGAFALYHATLLPGMDFGDTGSFQTTVGSAILTPRVGYPLYFAIGGAFLRLTGIEPARALNLVTALEAAVACGLFVVVAAAIAGSIAAAIAGAALLAVSYTFWSQSVIAEVYALHLALLLASVWLLLRWERRPNTLRLAAFFACYALSFGNHLSAILLAPAFTLFVLLTAPGGWRSMLRPRVIGMAAAFALAGASQYLWNIRALWFQLDAPHSMLDALRTFWFDVTKSDWRDTMVWEVPQSLLGDHVAMYGFDLRQQFGVVVPALAVVGLGLLWKENFRRGVLLFLLYVANVVFAFSYNVGDAHVFYLPSHVIVALLAVYAVAALPRLATHGLRLTTRDSRLTTYDLRLTTYDLRLWASLAAAALLTLYAAARGYRDFPALDRSGDARPLTTLRALTDGLDDRRAILLVDLNWQVANGLSYFGKSLRPELVVARARDVLLYAPALARANAAINRTVVASEQARRLLEESYGPLLTSVLDSPSSSFADVARGIPPGTRYAICFVKQSRDMSIDRTDFINGLQVLGVVSPLPDPLPAYGAVLGVAGTPAALIELDDRPFRRAIQLDGTSVEVRMESWMPSDTIRRMGFGHVIAGRRHTLIVERGVSVVTFDQSGSPLETAYFSGIFAIPRRYTIRTAW